MSIPRWRPIRLAVLVRAQQAGFEWADDPTAGPKGKAIRSPGGTVWRVKMLPLSVQRFDDRRFAA
jgi:hypothetical protein